VPCARPADSKPENALEKARQPLIDRFGDAELRDWTRASCPSQRRHSRPWTFRVVAACRRPGSSRVPSNSGGTFEARRLCRPARHDFEHPLVRDGCLDEAVRAVYDFFAHGEAFSWGADRQKFLDALAGDIETLPSLDAGPFS